MAMLQDEARLRFGEDAPVWVRSCGIHALENEPAVAGSRELALERGLDLGAHRGAQLDPADLRRCDLVVTMTERHRRHVGRAVPGVSARTFTLPELHRLVTVGADLVMTDAVRAAGLSPRERVRAVVSAAHAARPMVRRPRGSEDIADPYGRPESAYREMAKLLDELVPPVAHALFGPSLVDGEF